MSEKEKFDCFISGVELFVWMTNIGTMFDVAVREGPDAKYGKLITPFGTQDVRVKDNIMVALGRISSAVERSCLPPSMLKKFSVNLATAKEKVFSDKYGDAQAELGDIVKNLATFVPGVKLKSGE